jgi:peroxiredoxin
MRGWIGPVLGAGAVVLSAAAPVSAVRPLPWHVLSLEPAPAGIHAPDFALTDLSGRAVRRADLRGRWVLLNFWASWCAPCEMEMPAMQRLQARFKPSTLEVVAVNYREEADDVRRFATRRGIEFRVLLDPDGAVCARYQVGTLPFTVILSPQGEVVAAAEGPRDWASREAFRFFDGLIGRKP